MTHDLFINESLAFSPKQLTRLTTVALLYSFRNLSPSGFLIFDNDRAGHRRNFRHHRRPDLIETNKNQVTNHRTRAAHQQGPAGRGSASRCRSVPRFTAAAVPARALRGRRSGRTGRAAIAWLTADPDAGGPAAAALRRRARFPGPWPPCDQS